MKWRIERVSELRRAQAAKAAGWECVSDQSELFAIGYSGQIQSAISARIESPILGIISLPAGFPHRQPPVDCVQRLLEEGIAYLDSKKIPHAMVLADEYRSDWHDSLCKAGLQHVGSVGNQVCLSNHFPQPGPTPPRLARPNLKHPKHAQVDKRRTENRQPDRRPVELIAMAADRSAFVDMLISTCEGSRDLPILLASWTPQKMLEHMVCVHGENPAHWYMATQGGRALGVLLLDLTPQDWRIVYLGILASMRRKGYGRLLLRKGLQIAGEARAEFLRLCVDTTNLPAVGLYAKAGFLNYATQNVYFR